MKMIDVRQSPKRSSLHTHDSQGRKSVFPTRATDLILVWTVSPCGASKDRALFAFNNEWSPTKSVVQGLETAGDEPLQ